MLSQPTRSFTNNASGNLNHRQHQHKQKLIDLDDLDVDLLTPQFL